MKTYPERTPRRVCRPIAALAAAGLMSLSLAAPGTARGESQTWNTFLGGAGWDTGRGAVVDASGNVFVSGTADGTWGAPVRAHSGKNDVFVAKLDKSGKILWNTFVGSAGTDNGSTIALDPSGAIFVAGTSDASWGKPVASFAGGTDAFVAKLDPKGNLLWNTFVGGSASDQAAGVGVDSDGSLRLVGSSTGTWGIPESEYWEGSDGFAAKLDSAGLLVWNTFLGGTGEDFARGVVVGQDGEIFAVGTSTFTWGGMPIRGYSSLSDAWAAKVDDAGHLAWNSFIGGAGYDSGFGIAADAAGFAYVTGTSNASWGTPVVALAAGYDAFAAKLDPAGALVWNTFIGGDGKNFGKNIFVAPNGYVTVVGYGLGTWKEPLSGAAGGYDIFLCKLDNDGVFDWLTFVGGKGDDFAEAAATGPDSGVALAGTSDADWGAGVRSFSANYDMFVAWVPETPAAAAIVSAGAAAREERIELSWRTSGEPALAGFHVWRRGAGSEESRRVTDALIPGQGGPSSGSDYVYVDADVVPGESYSYEIEIVDRRDRSAFQGPIEAVAAPIRLLGPDQGAVILVGRPIRFGWEARGPVAFKVELSNQADFKSVRLPLPRDGWIEAKTYVPSRAEMDLIRRLSSTGRVVYWRVLGKMADGKVVISNARWFALRASR